MTEILFQELGMPVFTGRTRGAEARRRLKLPAADMNDSVVHVIVPEETYAVTSSYFLGMFGDSVRALGREEFLRKYKFSGPARILDRIPDWIERAVRDKQSYLRGG